MIKVKDAKTNPDKSSNYPSGHRKYQVITINSKWDFKYTKEQINSYLNNMKLDWDDEIICNIDNNKDLDIDMDINN